jgi:hypothetical protein
MPTPVERFVDVIYVIDPFDIKRKGTVNRI